MSQWQRMTDEQRKAHMEKNKEYRYKRKAKQLGISVEEYKQTLANRKGRPKKSSVVATKVEKSDEFVEPYDLSDQPDELRIQSEMYPWVTFVMRKDTAGRTGYVVAEKLIDQELFEKLREERENA